MTYKPLLLLLSFLAACQQSPKAPSTSSGESHLTHKSTVIEDSATLFASSRNGEKGTLIPMKYARNIVMVRYSDHTIVTLKDPWHKGKTLHTYNITTPVTRSIVFTAAHCQLLQWLDAGKAITGVCDRQYIHPSILNSQHSSGIADCGNSMSPDIEKIVSLRPQVLIVSPFENSGGFGMIEKTNIPIIEAAEYMEPTALGRAEWMKFYGILYGREREADSLFHVVDSTYHALKSIAKKTKTRPVLLTERKTGSVWYVPGGNSSVAQIITDAGGTPPTTLINPHLSKSGSLALSPEAVLAHASHIDIWAFKYTGSRPLSPQQLIAEYHGYKMLRAFQTGNVYQCNTLKQPYFEEISFRPDFLLREFIILLHPELHLGSLRYYTK